MSTTALTLQDQATALQIDLKAQLEAFFENIPEMTSLTNMRDALIVQSQRIAVTDSDTYISATEQVKALKSVDDQFSEVIDPFVSFLYKAHKTATGIRTSYMGPGQAEQTRLKREREAYAAEQERLRREAAVKAQREAFDAEQARLMAEASLADATGDSVGANAILEEAITLEVAPVVLPSTTPKVEGTSFRSVWKYEILDVTKLKPEFLIANDKAVGANVRAMHKTAEKLCGQPGAIRVWEEKVIIDK